MGKSDKEIWRTRVKSIARKKARANGTKTTKNRPKVPKIGKRSNVLNIINKKDYNFNFSNSNEIKKYVVIPESFSFYTNPDETLRTLWEINEIMSNYDIESLYLDYSRCRELSLDVSVITGIIVKSWNDNRKLFRKNIELSGNSPQDEAMHIFVNSGLPKHLNIEKREFKEFVILDPFKTTKDVVDDTNSVIIYYNNCIKKHGFELTAEGINHMNTLVGEIITNAKEHCGNDGDWFVSGHFYKEKNESVHSKGQLTFISFGNTIYENMLSVEGKVRDVFDNFFKDKKSSIFKKKFDKELLYNVLSLQYKISSKMKEKENDIDRGTGTIKFIEHFERIGNTLEQEVPKMSILSGKSLILFDGKYRITNKKNSDGKSLKQIAFNESNDLFIDPDPDYVKKVRYPFPGTAINVEFHVDEKYLEKFTSSD